MEINQPNDHEGEGLNPTPEYPPPDRPRIYVASLSDYNNGVLHGDWIAADGSPEEIYQSIQAMLERSPSGDAEEFAIHDYDNFSVWRPGESESIATVSLVARGMAEYGNAFAHWVALMGVADPDDLSRFADGYLGHWESLREYAESLIEDLLPLRPDDLPDPLSVYWQFDYDGFARDLELSGDVMTSEGDGGVYVFDGHQ